MKILKILKDEALSFFNLKERFPVILVLGGSLGAGSINKSLSENIAELERFRLPVVMADRKTLL